LESRLEELGVLRSFSRPRVSNDNPYSELLFRTVKYRPDYPRKPFASKEQACASIAAFVDWYNHRHRHSSIKFVTPVLMDAPMITIFTCTIPIPTIDSGIHCMKQQGRGL
jgi:transposase InsO family protein